MSEKDNLGLRETFFGCLMTFINDADLSPFLPVEYELCAEVTQSYIELIEILGAPPRSISELPENLQKIAIQSIPYFLKATSYTEDDIPY